MTGFTNDAGTGSVVADTVTATTITATAFVGPISGASSLTDGTAAAPSLSFTSDPDTGIFRTSANVLGVAAGGSSVGTFSSAGFTGAVAATTISASGVFSAAVGAVGAPGITFTGDTDTGLYWVSANSFALVANGAAQATITTGGINGILGATTPAAGSFTTLGASGLASLAGGTTETGAHIDTLTTVAAAGASQGTATAIATGANVVLITVTASTEGVKLPTPVAGRKVTIIANTAIGNKVYPASAGQSIGTATTATTAFVLAKTTIATFWASSTTKWNVLKGA